MPEHIRAHDEKKDSLREEICSGSLLELNAFDTDIIIGAQLEKGTAGLCYDIPTGSGQKVALHENPKRF